MVSSLGDPQGNGKGTCWHCGLVKSQQLRSVRDIPLCGEQSQSLGSSRVRHQGELAESFPASNMSASDISCFNYYYSDEAQLGLVMRGISSAIF